MELHSIGVAVRSLRLPYKELTRLLARDQFDRILEESGFNHDAVLEAIIFEKTDKEIVTL